MTRGGFEGERIQHGLQRRAAVHDHVVLAAVFSGLVIGDAELSRRGTLFDEVDGSVQPEAAVDGDRIASALRIAVLEVRQAEGPLERARNPCGIAAFITDRTRDFVDPQPEIAADRRNLIVPDPLDGRCELLVIIG